MEPTPAGLRFTRVTLFDVPGIELDSYGQPVQTGVEIGAFWARVVAMRGRQVQSSQTIWPMTFYEVHMDWLGSRIPKSSHNPLGIILPRMYLILTGNRRLDIVFADDIEERHMAWKLLCEEKVAT